MFSLEIIFIIVTFADGFVRDLESQRKGLITSCTQLNSIVAKTGDFESDFSPSHSQSAGMKIDIFDVRGCGNDEGIPIGVNGVPLKVIPFQVPPKDLQKKLFPEIKLLSVKPPFIVHWMMITLVIYSSKKTVFLWSVSPYCLESFWALGGMRNGVQLRTITVHANESGLTAIQTFVQHPFVENDVPQNVPSC